jgi:TolB protein
MDADGTNQRQLTRRCFCTEATGPDWAPNGTMIAYNRGTLVAPNGLPCCDDIWVMNADGSHSRRLTDTEATDTFPGWSPDGQRIAFARSPLDDNVYVGDLYTMDADGGSVQRITTAGQDHAPDWQPLPLNDGTDFRNAAAFCRSELSRLGEDDFKASYGSNKNGANAFGKCVSQISGR